MIDKIRLILALLLVAAGIGGFYLLGDKPAVLRVLSVLAGFGAAVAVMWTTALGREAVNFIKESAAEARKVVWPTRKETIQTTGAVFALVLVMGVILWVVDFSLLWFIKLILGRSA
ncbi:preprotein translocase subunit SecE [Novimethylophilus kurashikiensis]|uniref:Protein translocase subunit SecE n=1 Tax=Novimethylophilus kurashikiensis TaxID=1825523 RepID=A0A2R5FK03_9PROT|nr:preprotein translocase subunit SecE [Novimethylophilus kurashikiensis]GBG16014.1 preprotein translocase subunit SecE [Novimethylophilus kurashikiensis]